MRQRRDETARRRATIPPAGNHSMSGESMTEDNGGQPGAVLAREWREPRQALLALVEKLPETRASRNTERPGWTLKHELAHLASLDEELRHFLDSARAGLRDHDGLHHEALGLRRVRGQAMHAAQEMRLARLREHLATA